MYLNVDDIKFALVYIYRLTFFSYSRIRLQDSWLAPLCIHFLPLGSNFVFVLYKLNKKEIDNFLQPSCRIHVFIFSLERITINSYLKQTSSFAKWGGPTLIQTGLKEANLSSFV